MKIFTVHFLTTLLISASLYAETSFPPPDTQGGWPSLVPINGEPSAAQKLAVREKTGLDWDKLRAAERYCESFGTANSLLVIRHGFVVGEWRNFTNARGIASCTKSLTALAMAKLFDLSDAGQSPKRIDVDDEAWRFLPAKWAEAEQGRKNIRIRHLLTMTSGLTPYDGPYQADYEEKVFSQTVEVEPGKVWAYASVPVDMLSLIIENVHGQTEAAFFQQHIGDAIGTGELSWGAFGEHTGGSGGPRGGTRFTARQLARVGWMVVHDGRWGERQVIGKSRVREFTRWAPFLADAQWRQPNFAFEANANEYYGHLWWTNRTGAALGDNVPRDAIYMSGYGKQGCFVVPSLNMVVVRLGSDRRLNDHPEYYRELWTRIMSAVVDDASKPVANPDNARAVAPLNPFDGETFTGRIAWSSDGNFNDQDDWAASPMALAIFSRCGVAEKLVHFDYNCILYDNDPEWAKIHETSVVDAVARFGFRREVFHDCQQDLDAAVNSISAAINASSVDNPLWFVLAGPMEVPLTGMRKADPAKLPFVYCISHSRWNDGFDQTDGARFKFNKRSIIPLGVNWVQITDQNEFLSTSRYGAPAKQADWLPWQWMSDSRDADVRWLWDRVRAVTRADCSDAGMAYFLMTGDERAEIAKLRMLVAGRTIPKPIVRRKLLRIEAENFREFNGVELEYKNDRHVSHRINVKLVDARTAGHIQTRFDQPYAATAARYDIDIRCFAGKHGMASYGLRVNGEQAGASWQENARDDNWHSHSIPDVLVRRGDQITVTLQAERSHAGKIDYLEFSGRE